LHVEKPGILFAILAAAVRLREHLRFLFCQSQEGIVFWALLLEAFLGPLLDFSSTNSAEDDAQIFGDPVLDQVDGGDRTSFLVRLRVLNEESASHVVFSFPVLLDESCHAIFHGPLCLRLLLYFDYVIIELESCFIVRGFAFGSPNGTQIQRTEVVHNIIASSLFEHLIFLKRCQATFGSWAL
jgi:hypothetical protein